MYCLELYWYENGNEVDGLNCVLKESSNFDSLKAELDLGHKFFGSYFSSGWILKDDVVVYEITSDGEVIRNKNFFKSQP